MRKVSRIMSGVYPFTNQGKLMYAFHLLKDGWLVRYSFDTYEETQYHRELAILLEEVGISTE